MTTFLDMDLSQLTVPERTMVRRIFTATENTPNERTFYFKRNEDINFFIRLMKQVCRLVGEEKGYVFPFVAFPNMSIPFAAMHEREPELHEWVVNKSKEYKGGSYTKTKLVDEIPKLVFFISTVDLNPHDKKVFRRMHTIENSFYENKYIFLMI